MSHTLESAITTAQKYADKQQHPWSVYERNADTRTYDPDFNFRIMRGDGTAEYPFYHLVKTCQPNRARAPFSKWKLITATIETSPILAEKRVGDLKTYHPRATVRAFKRRVSAGGAKIPVIAIVVRERLQ